MTYWSGESPASRVPQTDPRSAKRMLGLAGSLLVFTGFWHALEWLMGGRNKDTLRLIPFGLIYLVLGYLIVTFTGGSIVAIIALVVTAIGLVGALVIRKTAQIRPWVIWTFIIIDVIIIAALGFSFLNS